jgi:hypothetical protein
VTPQAATYAPRLQFGVDPRGAVGLSATLVDLLDALREIGVGLLFGQERW